ncbi:glycoside hydrolase family 16 protein [Sporobolomyces salmoneus]|uniref:glycoside hydrolase family 16 protein n=1 Tax=Sporobolomyces salmoneus TaxID=183962 RepID=UPI00317E9E41
MTRHNHRPPRRRSSSRSWDRSRRSSDDKDSSQSESGTDSDKSRSSARSSRRSRRDSGAGSSEDSPTDSDSDSTDSSSDASSDWSRGSSQERDYEEKHYDKHDRARQHRKKQTRVVAYCVFGGIVFAILLVLFWVAQKNESAAGSSPGGTSGGTSSVSKSASASATKSSSGSGGSSASKTGSSSSSSGSSTSSTSSAATPDASNGGPYKLVQDLKGETFFDGWDFWDLADPTHGSVNYLSQDAAKSANLISTSADSIIMKVDNTTKLDAGKFRDSVRIHSKTPMKIGSILIADIINMPFGCATWPAWWSNGPNWPVGGEIDIIEGVNNQPENSITLHVSDSDCKQDTSVDMTGEPIPENDDCNANVKSNQGCSYREVADASYGEPFNKAGGGVLVTSFTKDAIEVWFWSRPNIPENIQKESPDRSTWGKPTASWPTSSCNIEKYFQDHGVWAGDQNVWKRDCGDKAATCQDFLQDPANFDNAYWEVGYVRVYEI